MSSGTFPKIVLSDMRRIIGTDVTDVLNKVAEAHRQFSEKTALALSTVK